MIFVTIENHNRTLRENKWHEKKEDGEKANTVTNIGDANLIMIQGRECSCWGGVLFFPELINTGYKVIFGGYQTLASQSPYNHSACFNIHPQSWPKVRILLTITKWYFQNSVIDFIISLSVCNYAPLVTSQIKCSRVFYEQFKD